MAERVTPEQTHAWLEVYFRQCRDIGLSKAVANFVLRSPNPFEPDARRSPRSELLYAIGFLACAVSWFFYFNFPR